MSVKTVYAAASAFFGVIAIACLNPGNLMDAAEWPTVEPKRADMTGLWSVDADALKKVQRWSGLPAFDCALQLNDDGTCDVSQLPARFLWSSPGAFENPRSSRTDLVTRSGTWRLEAEVSDHPEYRYWRLHLTSPVEPAIDGAEFVIWGLEPPYGLGIEDRDSDGDAGHYLMFGRQGDVRAGAPPVKPK